MKIKIENHRVLVADVGMVLTNGKTFGTAVLLPDGADPTDWQEITEAEAQEIIKRMEAEADV